MINNIKIFSFFAGCGFLDLGFEDTGFEIVYVNEINPSYLNAYRYSRTLMGYSPPEYGYSTAEEGNIEYLLEGESALNLWYLIQDARKSSDFVGFIGGPPCPDFSVGGKNRGKYGDQGKLSSSYVELIGQHQPDFFVFENVKGLYKTQKHRLFFEQLKAQLNEFGYILTEHLINAMGYGVPQNRERIILIGFSKKLMNGLGWSGYFKKDSIPSIYFPWNLSIIYPKEQVFSLPWPSNEPFGENSVIPCPDEIIEELTVEYWFNQNNVNHHPNAQNYFKPRAGLQKFLSIAEGDDSRKSYKRLHRWRYSPTACYGNNEVHLHPYKARRLSAAEALAIQSLPKNFCLPEQMSLTDMFKVIGNGVPYLASKGIANSIMTFLSHPIQLWNTEQDSVYQLELPLSLA
ncbi:DNA cytosine methyltransferase [Spirulina subsalsa FACHB-351]|uniref:DNA (cytosine-5-)-methyltransferase n=1 Tax=Spirulina subsalsa FACHB-351 TaxID=234711 RepID=A0ABT3L5G4_9CYAN|nr:DNA cytosine methyltransferase [Spirulina subsalsa]MCW6036720.1 DNA cytosine methyltransferase [Spirulina subsalsa FACHB-351]